MGFVAGCLIVATGGVILAQSSQEVRAFSAHPWEQLFHPTK
jgi:hypothetical protein